jgi:hypothetical protein
MNRQLPVVEPGHLIKLAAMECFTSCVLTYIRMIGRGREQPMPDYWNLSYQFRTLLSSKDAKQFSLPFHYGVAMDFTRGDCGQLQEAIAAGKTAILLSAASRWSYFPASMLGLENAGFQHCVLVCGWDGKSGKFRIADPMLEHIGDASADEVTKAGMRSNGRDVLHFFTLEPPASDFRPPAAAQVFRYSSERNWQLFDSPSPVNPGNADAAGTMTESERRQALAEWFGGRNSGSRAFDQCMADLAALPEWEPAVAKKWFDRNNLTVTSIWMVRMHVWDCFCRLEVMNDAESREGSDRVRRIVRQWQSLNFQVSKFKKTGVCTAADAAQLSQMLMELRSEERRFLSWMHELGKTIEARANAGS